MAMARITTTLALLATLSAPAAVAQDAGGYLAARSAMLSSDFDEAADYYARAIVRDPSNVPLLENAATAYLGLGDLDRAAQIARRAFEAKSENQLVGLMLIGDMARRDDWKGIVSGIDGGMKVGPLFDGLAKAWALVGDGQMTEALTAFDGVAVERRRRSLRALPQGACPCLGRRLRRCCRTLLGRERTHHPRDPPGRRRLCRGPEPA